MDAATAAVAKGLRPGALVTYETTLPVGDTRDRYQPMLERLSGLSAGGEGGFFLAFSPERVFSGRIMRDLATYPKLVGGVDPASTKRAAAFYRSVLTAEVWELGSAEAAEFAKLAETTYRDVNIALANEFARYADRVGVDILEVIRGANSQPYSHIHQPGIGVGGHCIPVYPHFMLARAGDLSLVERSRQVNDGQVDAAIDSIDQRLGGLEGATVLVLGLTYRENVMELAYSRALPLIARLRERGAAVEAYDPLLDGDRIERCGATPYVWGTPSRAAVLITQTADPRWLELDTGLLPDLRVVYDGRNSLRALGLPADVVYLGVGSGGS
jgi:nucleotide sugar dehydrogenase